MCNCGNQAMTRGETNFARSTKGMQTANKEATWETVRQKITMDEKMIKMTSTFACHLDHEASSRPPSYATLAVGVARRLSLSKES